MIEWVEGWVEGWMDVDGCEGYDARIQEVFRQKSGTNTRFRQATPMLQITLSLVLQCPPVARPTVPCLNIGESFNFSQSSTIMEFRPEETTVSRPLSTSPVS